MTPLPSRWTTIIAISISSRALRNCPVPEPSSVGLLFDLCDGPGPTEAWARPFGGNSRASKSFSRFNEPRFHGYADTGKVPGRMGHARKGTVLMEFALVVPRFLLLCVAGVDFARVF